MRLAPIAAATMLCAVTLGQGPQAGRYTTARDGDPTFKVENFGGLTIALTPAASGNGNFNVSGWLPAGGPAGGFTITGSLFSGTNRLTGTISAVDATGKKIETHIDGYWDPAAGTIVLNKIADRSIPLVGETRLFRVNVQGSDFSGVYKTGPTYVYLNQFGNEVTGWASYADGRIYGQVQSNGTLTFRWNNANGMSVQYTLHKDAEGGLEGETEILAPVEKAGEKGTAWLQRQR